MKPEIKALFVDALRSGKYKQQKSRLRTGGSFCIMGVLCNLHAQAHPKIAAAQKDASLYMGNGFTPPKEVIQWAGLSSVAGPELYIPRKGTYSLMEHNDNGVTFDKLADAIEAQL